MLKPGAIIVALVVALLTLALVPGCTAERRAHSITVAGSTSVQPFVELLSEEFAKQHNDLVVNVQGGGSSAGIQAAIAGAAEIGMSSRDLKPAEKELKQFLIARDAIAVIVHPENPLRSIDLDTLRKIFTGSITSWDQLGWAPKPVTVISREEGSGTRGAFDELVMRTAEVWPGCLVQDSNGSVRVTVAQDRYSIGYISLGLADESVRTLSLDAVEPTFDNASSGKYPLVRPFLFVLKNEPQGLAKQFIDYVLSEEGQKILREEGLVPAVARTAR
ncbi:MAG: phosphate ABC transporter substrate-binding protein [Bacillota bacterium]|nr:phosphate ABC transporter substrate-binding protein [Bacillota bacterium]